eukprot:CAMPEP_0177716942 /NCGR_PEP_ID=MMETSP0484_2-20121128/14770_1 /TAXON_ID=354590 /ORGANISM="Rhodomonas lens, Strain RHODO" /LENGTH=366 /DNA_ID=CAMNT_0019228989 /DNA_START=9 /DNA_END=1109 /DNA_ORIENTATION=-
MGLDAAEQALKEDLDRKRKKTRFGDEFGRVGRRRKGQGKHFQEEVDRFGEDDDEDEDDTKKHRVDKSESSMKTGRDLKAVEGAAEDWEHEEDSEEEAERRRYEEESGIRMEPFNTDMDRETGHFEGGHFIEDKFKMSQRDAWLDEVADKYAHGKKEKVPERKGDEDEAMEEDVDPQSLLKFLVEQLKPEENVAAALRRMRAEKKTGTDFDGITEATNKLLASGYHNVFSDPREKIQMRIKIDESEEKEDDGRVWEYKCFVEEEAIPQIDPPKMSIKALRAFLEMHGVSYEGIVEKEDLEAKAKQTCSRIRNQANEVHGPFSTLQMRQWAQQGYFSGPKVALIRQLEEGRDLDFVRSDRVDLGDMFN